MAPHNLRVEMKLCADMLDWVMMRWKRHSPLPFSSDEEERLGLCCGWVEWTAAVASITTTIEMSQICVEKTLSVGNND